MFYTYIWYSEDGTPFYVGKGSGNRFSSFTGRDDAFVKKIKSEKCYVQIDDVFSKESDAFSREDSLIDQYGRIPEGGLLFNKRGGSEMTSLGVKSSTLEQWTKDAIDSAIAEFKKIASADSDPRMLRIDRVLELIPVSRVTLYRMIKAGQFPRPVKLGGSSAWSNQEIRKWRNNLLSSRLVAEGMVKEQEEKAKRRRKREMSDLV